MLKHSSSAQRESSLPQLPAVLIADDDNIHQAIISAMVKKMGFAVFAAYDGIQAVETFEKHEESIGCILLDIQMPNMNGIQVLEHLRKVGTEVPVIIVSGYLDKAKREQLDSLYPQGYLSKPIDYQLLSEELTTIIKMDS